MTKTIKELITATPLKVQVALDADSTDQQIMSALDDTCRGLAQHEATGQKLKWVLAEILIMVRERKLWTDGFDTFEAWLTTSVLDKYKLSRSIVLEAVQVLDTIPEAAKLKIPTANLVLVARAVNASPENQRARVKQDLLSQAKQPVSEFRAKIQTRFALRRHGKKMATIVLHVPSAVAAAWRDFVGERSGADVLAQLIGYGVAKKSVRSASRVA